MKNTVVNIMNDKLEVVKTYGGFESHGCAVEFARDEAEWRGCMVEVAWMDDADNHYSRLF